MMAQCRNFGKAFKTKVAPEAIRDEKTINEIASIYGIHPNQFNKWKRLDLKKLPEIMEDNRTGNQHNENTDQAQLPQKIGQIEVEIDFLKKKLVQLGSQDQ